MSNYYKKNNLEVLDFNILSLPSRSILYSLPPISNGDHGIEHLISYTARLAIAHHMNYRDFMRRVIFPMFNRDYLSNEYNGGQSLASFFSQQNTAVLGTRTLAAEFINVIENITKQPNIKFMTMTPYSSLVSYKKLISNTIKWCPICLDEMYGKIVYEPLTWAVNATTICPLHKIKLHTECHKCNSHSRTMPIHNYPGYCPNCYHWLGISAEKRKPRSRNQRNSEWLSWCSNAIYDLLALNNTCPKAKADIDHFSKTITEIRKDLFEGKSSALASYVNLSDSTVIYWEKRKQLPTIQNFLNVIYCFFPSLRDYLIGDIKPKILRKARDNPKPTVKLRTGLNKKELHSKLLELMEEDKKRENSYTYMARKLNTDPALLKKWFPNEVAEIIIKYRGFRLKKKKLAEEEIYQAVSNYIKIKVEANEIPSRYMVGQAIGQVFIQKNLMDIYDQALADLRKKGYNIRN